MFGRKWIGAAWRRRREEARHVWNSSLTDVIRSAHVLVHVCHLHPGTWDLGHHGFLSRLAGFHLSPVTGVCTGGGGYLEQAWGNLLLGQVALHVVHGLLGKGLQTQRKREDGVSLLLSLSVPPPHSSCISWVWVCRITSPSNPPPLEQQCAKASVTCELFSFHAACCK